MVRRPSSRFRKTQRPLICSSQHRVCARLSWCQALLCTAERSLVSTRYLIPKQSSECQCSQGSKMLIPKQKLTRVTKSFGGTPRGSSIREGLCQAEVETISSCPRPSRTQGTVKLSANSPGFQERYASLQAFRRKRSQGKRSQSPLISKWSRLKRRSLRRNGNSMTRKANSLGRPTKMRTTLNFSRAILSQTKIVANTHYVPLSLTMAPRLPPLARTRCSLRRCQASPDLARIVETPPRASLSHATSSTSGLHSKTSRRQTKRKNLCQLNARRIATSTLSASQSTQFRARPRLTSPCVLARPTGR
mmetsp:Transcript_3517/g.5743  ORF Transcript_3517/g.5743 Transcript_3517/m.5743 type:complete len:305 (+) Transcript_3517:1422-2336(+)